LKKLPPRGGHNKVVCKCGCSAQSAHGKEVAMTTEIVERA
jgi:hypothetical protein